MKLLAAVIAAFFVLAVSGRAEAQVLTFDELAPTENPYLGTIECSSAGRGFRFSSDHFHLIGIGNTELFATFSSNDTPHIGYESGRGFPVTLARVGGGAFSLISLDAAEFYSSFVPDRPDAERLTITGTQVDGGTVTHTVDLDGIYDGSGGVVDFQHFVLPSTFVNLTSVVFTGLLINNNPGGVAVDNLEYQLDVPEPLGPCVVTPLPQDTPTVVITNPAPGNVSGTILVEATAADNLGVVGVQFKLNGVNLGAEDTEAPYAAVWDTTTVADGPQTLTADARDAANNVASASVVVTVRNTPIDYSSPHFVQLDGVDDYVEVADGSALSFGNGTTDTPLTMEVWFHPDTMAGKQQLLSKWGETANQEYRLFIGASTIRVDLRDHSAGAIVSAYTTAGQAGLAGAWHHLAVTYDGRGGATAAAGLTIYIDGVVAPVTRINNAAYMAMENLAAPLQIGRESASWKQYDGGLDEVRLWTVARTAAQLQASMTTELTGLEPGLVAYWRFNEGTGITVEDDSSGAQAATLFSGTAWVAGGPLGSSGPDEEPPQISNAGTTNLTDTGVTIGFNTNETATGWVSYTAAASCPCTDVYSAGPGTAHSVMLTTLTPDTLYQYWVKAIDAAGNLQVGPGMSFRTAAPLPDSVPPSVSITQPSGITSGTVQAAATATDNVGVVGVQFKLDGVNLGAEDTTAPYSTSWNTTLVADGSHTLTADARDAIGNVGSISLVVTVRNTPVTTTPHFVELDGVNDYVEVADGNALSFGNGTTDTPLTMELWFRPDTMAGKQQLLSKWGETANQEYRLFVGGGTIRVDLRDHSAGAIVSAYTTAGQAGLAGAWHHLAVTYDGRGGAMAAAGLTIYIDGVVVPVTRINNAAYMAMENLAASLQIGRESPSFKQYDGGLDEVRLWTVARTQAQIQAGMTTEMAGTESELVAYWRFNEGSGTTVEDGSPGSLTASLFSGTAWAAGGPLGPSGPDEEPPQISNAGTTNLTDTGVTIGFNTNETATGWVWYTAAASCPCTDVYSAGPGTAHSVMLTTLTPDTLYQYWVKAIDAAGNLQVGPGMSFRTAAPLPDSVPPSVSITQPSGITSGTVQAAATATDNVGVVGVQFKLDGVNLGAEDTTAPYSTSWNTTLVADGSHTLTADARDAIGNVGSISLVVTVRNTPVTTTPHFVELDGVNDYVEVADGNALSFGNGTTDTPLTMELWFRPDTMAGKQQLLSKWGETANQEYRLFVGGGTIRVDLRDHSAGAIVSAYTTAGQAGLAGAWHHLAVTYDGRGGAMAAAGLTIYIDGVVVPVTRINNAAYMAMENLAASLQIGRESPSFKQYDGGLDEVRLWTVARTQAQIQAGMTTEMAGTESELVAYWRFNEGSGTTVEDGSPGSLTASLFSGTAWAAGGPLASP